MALTVEEAFATNLRERRKQFGWSQEQLAAEMRTFGASTTRDSLAKLETGRRQDVTLTELIAAAEALVLTPLALLLPREGELLQASLARPATTRFETANWLTGEERAARILAAAKDLLGVAYR